MMNKIQRLWESAGWEAYVSTPEPPMVQDKLPAARVFNWRVPAPQPRWFHRADPLRALKHTRPVQVGVQCWWFARLAIGGALRSMACHFLGHDPVNDDWAGDDSGYMGVTCNRCGKHNGSYLY